MRASLTTSWVAVKLAATLAFVLLGCAACAPGPARPSLARCSAFGVQAIRRHVIVQRIPAACAGLSRAQVNGAMATAVRDAVGPRPKAAARSLAARDSKYIAPLITTISPPPPASVSTASAPPASGAGLSLAALACWVLTASAGSYLFIRTHAVRRSRGRWRARGSLGAIVLGHVGAAVACVGTLAAFAVTGTQAVGWAAVGLVSVTAGFGMATLVTALPEPGATPRAARAPTVAAARRQQSLVGVIALHGVLATVTILLIWLAVVASS
jgi:hypothetical protein